ncbi:hypothetical protein J3R73_002976 [Labrys monachus]|uniref:Uncharacterized protein n=1 Tax=Labrys monachus TaxID=217067 RepID=A0ABU0FEZ2_9HYPH|nr:hypothetical protein [Labrys monachus]
MKTIQLVRSIINQNYPHLGGIGEIKAARRRIKKEKEKWNP